MNENEEGDSIRRKLILDVTGSVDDTELIVGLMHYCANSTLSTSQIQRQLRYVLDTLSAQELEGSLGAVQQGLE